MKKTLIILFFVPVFCFGQSPLVINGPTKTYISACTGINYIAARGGIGSFETDTVNSGMVTAGWGGTLVVYPIYRIIRSGIVFDCSSIPFKSVIDSIKLDFDASLTSVPAFFNFYACPEIDPENETKSLTLAFRDLVKSVAGVYVAMKTIWLTSGSHSVTFYDASFSNVYPRAISIGFGMVTGDATPPYVPYLSWGSINSMVMTIYYHGGGTPSPKKIKIIGVI
jgi:hypothetical protein